MSTSKYGEEFDEGDEEFEGVDVDEEDAMKKSEHLRIEVKETWN